MLIQTAHAIDVVRIGSWQAKTPVGIEPTSTGLQPVAWPSGSSVGFRKLRKRDSNPRRTAYETVLVAAPVHSADVLPAGLEPAIVSV